MSTSFWGQIFKAGSSQEVQIPEDSVLTLTMLAFSGKEGSKAQVFVQTEGSEKVLLCTLREGTIDQIQTDLEFTGAQQTSFSVEGSGSVHATGFLSLQLDDEEGFDFGGSDDEEEEESEEEEEKPAPPPKAGKQSQGSKQSPQPVEKRKSEEAKSTPAKKQQKK
eukprot:TRINITY_DN10445_c0_g1_i1.p1 TRINITY_DN10445_c0_g1~~TRINITY_DN10445_c0_g1_i1.p1  ORF type:complete len:164 (-),score=92.87 TRINITY_DN10445_c0_g1_i1:150-641(-)